MKNESIEKRSTREQSNGQKGRSDWKRLESMTDEDIDVSDIPELGKDFFENAKIVLPEAKEKITIRIDSDMLRWFKLSGKGYQTRMNAVLRAYFESERNREPA